MAARSQGSDRMDARLLGAMRAHPIAAVMFGACLISLCGCTGARRQPIAHTVRELPVHEQPVTQAAPAQDTNVFAPRKITLASVSEETEPASADPLIPDEPQPFFQEFATVAPIWTLASLEATALENNPAIREASASAHKAMGYHDQVGTRPNPTVGYNGTQLADRGTEQHIAFVEQDFVLGDKLSRNQAVLGQEVESQLWEVEAQRYRVLTDVRRHYYEALSAQRRLDLATEFIQIAAKGVDVAQARVEAKEGSLPEVLQAEIQFNQVEVQRRQADAAYRGAWNQLMAVTGISGAAPGQLEGTLPGADDIHDLHDVKSLAMTSSPELQAARARVARARAQVDRQQAQPIPNLSVMFAAGYDQSTNHGMINAQAGLPLPLFNRNDGNVAAAAAELMRACQEVRRIELSIESRMARAAQDYEGAAAAVEQYEQVILPKAGDTLRLAEQAYSAGEFGFLEMLIARRTYFETHLEYVASQTNLALAQAYLDGFALSGGLDQTPDTGFDSGLRDQSLSGQ